MTVKIPRSLFLIPVALAAAAAAVVAGAVPGAQQPPPQPPPQQPSVITLTITGDNGTAPRLAVPDFIPLSQDAETAAEREFTATPATQAAYRTALAGRTQEVEDAARRRGLRFARLTSDQPVEDMVQRTLRQVGLLG